MRLIKIKNMKDKRKVIIFVLVFAVIGVATLVISKAATPTVLLEAEGGSVTDCATSIADTAASGGSALQFGSGQNSTPPYVFLRYEPPTVDAYAEVRCGDIVVGGVQANDTADRLAVSLIRDKGGIPYRYVQWYWLPSDRPNRVPPDPPTGPVHDGLNIVANPGWAFCESGETPLTDTASHPGQTWTYLDMNEKAARNAMVARLRHLQSLGYVGIFSDIGDRALTVNQLDGGDGGYADATSTCTYDPVVGGRTLAQAYVGMLRQAHSLGLKIVLNGGSLKQLEDLGVGPPAGPRVGLEAFSLVSHVLDEGAAKRGVLALRDDAEVAARQGIKALTLIRPETDKSWEELPEGAWKKAWDNAREVLAVQVVDGVRSGGQP